MYCITFENKFSVHQTVVKRTMRHFYMNTQQNNRLSEVSYSEDINR